jgi:hypothetical protein
VRWEDDLEEATRRLDALDVGREERSARAAVATWRRVDPFSSFFLPLPLVAQRVPSLAGAWRDEGDERGRGEHVGLDAHGRPVVHVLDFGSEFERAKHLWWWEGDGSFWEIELMGSGPHVRRARVVDGRIAYVATATDGGSSSVELLRWQGDQAVRSDLAERWVHGSGHDAAVEADIAPSGVVERLRRRYEDPVGDLAAGVAHAGALVPDTVLWDGRVSRPEPWPGEAAAAALVEPLAVALDAALRAATAAAAIEQPFLLEVRQHHDGPAYPPAGWLAGVRWRDRMRAASRHDGAPLSSLWRGVESGEVAELDLVDHLDEPALRSCRMLSTALRTGAPSTVNRAAAAVADALGDRLAALLHAAPPARAADPFLALVHVGDPYGHDPELPMRRARNSAGDASFDRFMRSVASTAARSRAPDRARALVDRDALEALVRAGGLTEHARRLAHEVASEGLRILPGRGARSRLGGPPLLPPGAEWPTSREGRALTFLAGIDLTELPPAQITALLPAAGWLLFFADLGTGDGDGLIDEADNADGSLARLLPADDPVDVAHPATLRERRVAFERRLTLPDGFGAPDELGLDVYEAEAYEEVLDQLGGRGDDDHWIGGHATGVQGAPPDPDTVLLLHLAWDEQLGFEFLDGGAIQFRIPAAALAARDWSQVFVEADSC